MAERTNTRRRMRKGAAGSSFKVLSLAHGGSNTSMADCRIRESAAMLARLVVFSPPAVVYGIGANTLKNVPDSMPEAAVYPTLVPTNPAQCFLES